MTEARDFLVRASFDEDGLVGVRWWNESFEAFAGRRASRRAFTLGVPLAIGAGVAAIAGIAALSDDDEVEVSLAALELQRKSGWNAGYVGRQLSFAGATPVTQTAIGTLVTRFDLQRLGERLEPEARLKPHQVRTLFQALADAQSGALLDSVKAIRTEAMEAAFARGVALRDLMARPESPAGVALMIDLPGPEAIAVAAGLCDRFCPVFTFDNWPHPLGVVPSHLTLGACAYYLPTFEAGNYRRQTGSMPVFVLDANRLAPYRDDADQFDNRYVAPVPSAASLGALGIKRLLYLRPDGNTLTELDDLNGDFVAWQREGLEVRAVALSDFKAQQDGAGAALATVRAADPAAPVPYFYGGHTHFYPYFWSSYGWGGTSLAPRTRLPPRPSGLSSAPAYRPTFRPTMFASRTVGGGLGVGKQKPSGFGRVSVRMAGGQPTSWGSGSRRSGSFGRSRSSFFG